MSTPLPGTAVTNGTTPHEPVDPLAPIIAELEEQLAPLSARRAQLESQIAELLTQEQRIKAGISALSTGPKRKASKPSANSHDWTPAQKTLDDVYATIAKGPEEGMTLGDLDEALDVSRGTISKAIDELRRVERVRLMGTAARQGSPRLYGVMP